MKEIEQINPKNTSKTPQNTSIYNVPTFYSFLKVIEYLLLAAVIASFILLFALNDTQKTVIYLAVFFASFLFFFILNKQLWSDFKMNLNRSEIIMKSEIQSSMLETAEGSAKNIISTAITRALTYCQELIDDYKNTRRNSRNIYYISQISTIILSGVTPILVVVERLDSGPVWFKWLPVFFPATAAIISSIVTSFPFQENWIEANKTVELLEAEQEKFVLGISQAYRCYDVTDRAQRQTKAKKAIENFITQVNNIHLKQIQELAVEKVEAEVTAQKNT
ncbi:MAG: DUF4231 domain-containing protein [Microcoleaceae cyanobacterium]